MLSKRLLNLKGNVQISLLIYLYKQSFWQHNIICRAALNLLIMKPVTFSCLSLSGILVLTQIINPFRTIPFNMKDQFGLAYGGLRGAVSFALAFTLPDTIGRKQLFVTATIAVILFTVFLQVRERLCRYIFMSVCSEKLE